MVDDEQHQLDSVCRGLRLYGFDAHGVHRVDAAIERLAAGDHFDLLITDLTMPGRSGLDLLQRVRQDWPGLPVLVTTGLAETHEVRAVRALGVPLLGKPFGPDELDAAVRGALD